MKLAFFGLGNPGERFKNTRHNVGFMVMDRLAERLGLKFLPKGESLIAKGELEGKELFLVKPQTYMNMSGGAVRDFLNSHTAKVVVVFDETDIPLGEIRVRERGSTTHNGVLSILSVIDDFVRVRIGIGKSRPLHEYVLGKFERAELERLNKVLDVACNCLIDMVSKDLERVMNDYNKVL